MDKKTTKSQSIHRQGIKISTIKSNHKPFFFKKEKGKNIMDIYISVVTSHVCEVIYSIYHINMPLKSQDWIFVDQGSCMCKNSL